ncbi:MAG: PaaI family thioesterase [Solirubrobacteraceae bacterium]
MFGAELVAVGDGEALFRCTPDAPTYNPIGMVHGGLLCTLLDSAAGCAVHTRPPAGARYAPIEIKVSYLQPVRADQGAIEVLGRALRVGRRVAFAKAHARDANGALVGHATTSIAVSRLGLAPVGRTGAGQARAAMIAGLPHPVITRRTRACPAIVDP